MAVPLHLLLIEDSEDDALLLLNELRRGDWEVVHERVQTAVDMAAALERRIWDIIISDYSMPQFNGLAAIKLAREKAPDLPLILVSGTVGEEVAVEIMKAGADDYLFKGNLRRLVPAVRRELREAEIRREARRMEGELHKRERQLADAQRLARLGSWHIDVGSNVVTLSPEAFRLLGRSSRDSHIPFGEFLEYLHTDDRPLLSNVIHDRGTGQFARDIRIVRPDGETRFAHIRGDIVRSADGSPAEAAGMIQDITDRKLAEQDLQRAHDELAAAKEAAESSNRAKDRFLAVVSHELRTPLTPVLALVSEMEGDPQLSADVRQNLAIIRRNVMIEARLIDDLLDVTRIVQGKIELHFEVVDAHQVLQNALRLFEVEIAAKSLVLTVELRAVRHHVWADPVRLEQVFMNLLSNAVKFTASGGRVLVSSRNDAAGSKWCLWIEDNGIGIEASVLPRLFASFEQGERTVTREFGGLGLGLAITRTLVELHHGRIHVHSEGRHKGTVAELELTSLMEREPKRVPVAIPVPERRPKRAARILLVEDHPDTRRVMTRLLEASGCSVISAGSVQEALKRIDQDQFELLISDIGLPDGSGLEVMRHLRTRGHVPGIAISGFGQADDIQRSRDAGFEVHLTKPVDFGALMALLNNVLA